MKLNLTKSETKIVELKAKGYPAKKIGDMRFVSINTVKTHIKNALKRNKLGNGFELVARYAASNPEIFKPCLFNSESDLIRLRRTKKRIERVRKLQVIKIRNLKISQLEKEREELRYILNI